MYFLPSILEKCRILLRNSFFYKSQLLRKFGIFTSVYFTYNVLKSILFHLGVEGPDF